MQVPDAIEPAIGYRVWKVDNNRLCSLIHHTLWLPYERMQADCRVRAHTGVPVESCSCGFYATATFNSLFDMGYTGAAGLFASGPDNVYVIAGTVKMWGKIIPGTKGWRAEFVYPEKLLIPYSLIKLGKVLSDEYGVPFKPFNPQRRH
jgi:hypothetical protein